MNIDKRTVIDIVLSILLAVAIIFEIKWGFGMLTKKWETDTSKLISEATAFGQNIAIIDTSFSWPEADTPSPNGDVVKIDNNKFRINGTVSDNSDTFGTIYYADLETKQSRQLYYREVVSSNEVYHFQVALERYFAGDIDTLVKYECLSTDTPASELMCYQQSYNGGVIPVIYDTVKEQYCMLLDCDTSYYLLKCSEPFELTDGRVTVHYADPLKDPMRDVVWNYYEEGAIDNTRWQLNQGITYDKFGNPIAPTTGDASGSSLSGQTDSDGNSSIDTLYKTAEDDEMRRIMVSYSDKEFDADGKALDGTTALDLTSTAAKASEWVLTETSYSFTDNGLTINGLSGKRTSSEFEISGNVSNMLSSERPWVLVVKFLNADNNLLGVRVLDNRTNTIAADSVATFTVTLDSSSNIDFAQITAVQFAIH